MTQALIEECLRLNDPKCSSTARESRQSAGFAPERIWASIYKTKPIANQKERSSRAREQVFWVARKAWSA